MLRLSVIGNIGSDAELKYASSGSPILRFNVAANSRVKAEGGAWTDRTDWVRCTVFGQRAESLSNLLTKGMRVYVDGRLEARPWTDRAGNVQAGLEIVVDSVEFMSQRNDPADPMTPRSTVNRQPAPAGVSDDDDIPF